MTAQQWVRKWLVEWRLGDSKQMYNKFEWDPDKHLVLASVPGEKRRYSPWEAKQVLACRYRDQAGRKPSALMKKKLLKYFIEEIPRVGEN